MGNEFRVNTYQNNWQRNPDIVTFADGSFLVTWDSYFNNYDDTITATFISSQRYNALGQRVGGEVPLAITPDTSGSDARTTRLTDGGYVVVWEFDDYSDILTTNRKVFVKVYNADGSVRVSEQRVDTIPGDDAVVPEVFATANGGFKVVFGVKDSSSTIRFEQIYSQQYTALGVKVGGNTLVNTNVGEFDQIYARSATLKDGKTITIWNSEASFPTPGDLYSNEIRATLTSATGSVLRGDFSLTQNYGTVGGGSGAGYDVAALANGGFAITHLQYDFNLGLDTPDTSYYTLLQMFNAAGQATSGKIKVFFSDDLPDLTRVVQLTTGQIVVIWEQDSTAPGAVANTIYGRVFSATGQSLSGRFEIGMQADAYDAQSTPEIAALAGGGFVVTYTSESIDSDHEGIAARIYGRGTAGNDIAGVDVTGTYNGLSGNDRLTGNILANVLRGASGSDTLYGGANADRLYGDTDNDILVGGTEGDTIFGGIGNDLLYGGAGADKFVFLAPGNATTNTDRIADLDALDKIWLDNAAFAALGLPGTLKPYYFKVLGTGGVVDANDHLIYTPGTGTLAYDSNGSAAGGRVVIAILLNQAALTYDDFVVF